MNVVEGRLRWALGVLAERVLSLISRCHQILGPREGLLLVSLVDRGVPGGASVLADGVR